jgi:hypothetical protein
MITESFLKEDVDALKLRLAEVEAASDFDHKEYKRLRGEMQKTIIALEGDLLECKQSNDQAWGICNAVATALGDSLDKDQGSAESIIKLKEDICILKKDREAMSVYLRTVRDTVNGFQKQLVRTSDLRFIINEIIENYTK